MDPLHTALAGRLDAILEKLSLAGQHSGREQELGVAKHGFRLHPPLPEADLDAFERRHGVRLPDDYRFFLLRAGNGGAGPYYGIEPLSDWDHWFEEEAEAPGFLAAPCPLTPGPHLAQAWRAAAAGSGWSEFVPGRWDEWGRGTLHICDQGCTFTVRLVVSGAARGRIVYLDAQGWRPPYFVRDLSFFDWYERWLDAFLTDQPLFWYGMDNPTDG